MLNAQVVTISKLFSPTYMPQFFALVAPSRLPSPLAANLDWQKVAASARSSIKWLHRWTLHKRMEYESFERCGRRVSLVVIWFICWLVTNKEATIATYRYCLVMGREGLHYVCDSYLACSFLPSRVLNSGPRALRKRRRRLPGHWVFKKTRFGRGDHERYVSVQNVVRECSGGVVPVFLEI